MLNSKQKLVVVNHNVACVIANDSNADDSKSNGSAGKTTFRFYATRGNCVKLQGQQIASSFIFSMSVVLVSTLSVWGADLSLKWG